MYVECSMQSDNIPHNTIQSNHNVCYPSTISLMQSSLTINHCQLYCKEHLDQHSIAYVNPNTTIIRKKCSAYGGPKYNKLLNNALFFQRKTTIFPSKINENKPLMLLVVSGIRTVATILHQPRTVLRRNLINL